MLSLALSTTGNPSFSSRLIYSSRKQYQNDVRNSHEKLLDIFQKECGKILESWKLSLAGPGIREDTLFCQYVDIAFDEDFQTLVFRALLEAIGAHHPAILGHEYAELWTTNNEIVKVLVNSIIAGGLSNPEEAKVRIQSLLQGFPADDVFEVLSAETR